MSDKKTNAKKLSLHNIELEGDSEHHPSEFMRARHPDLFSDSKITTIPQLSREVFDHYLETLTNRKQETEFEHFARRLAEKEICPNLITQTGPVGGGDSKVDTETYPVADSIALRWYEGTEIEAAKERWAFAFSAKKDWRSKIQSDVKKIVETNREYKRIIFITNQFVKDKTKAEVEDKLTNEHKISVRIFDRSWILKCVFENGRINIAVETLHITGYNMSTIKEAGTRDVKRQTELKELEELINDPNRYENVEYQLVEDCLQAALLARGLELPRVDVEGRFKRAERIAEKVNHRQQKLRVSYNRAWTVYWWYEDFEEFNLLYNRVEELTVGSIQASDVELLSNIWQLLHTAVNRGAIGVEKAKLVERTKALKAELDRLARDTQRPNNAHQAKTILFLVELSESFIKGENVDAILVSLKDVLEQSVGLTEYSVVTVTQIIQELGNVLTDNPKYDELLDVVVNITQQRTGEGEAGNVLLTRGSQKLLAGKRYDAIKLLGRAQQKLALEEYKSDWVRAAVACGLGYEGIGLLWAARSNILMATNISFSEYNKHGALPPQSLLLAQKLVWIELQLGRIPHVLAWMELASVIANQLLLDNSQKEKYLSERNIQDAVLGILFLKTEMSNLKWLDVLPPVLEQANLITSWMALLYALGYEDYLRSEKVIPEDDTPDATRDFFYLWLNQPASKDLPDQPELYLENKVTLHSYVLGCDVVIDASNNLVSIYLAETILGALEAFLATSFDSEIIPYRSELRIVVQPSDFLSGLPEYRDNDVPGEQTITIRHPKTFNQKTQDERNAFRLWLQDFIIHLALQIAAVFDAKSFTDRLIKGEAGIGRALIFAEVDLALENIFGNAPKFQLSDWKLEGNTSNFPCKRDAPWNIGLLEKAKDEKEPRPVRYGAGEPPSGLFSIDNLKHKDRKVISLINIPLWNKAQWQATVYICVPGNVPIIALGFRDIEAAKLIFKEWRNKLGEVDKEEQLRISFITGINKWKPANYKVIVSANPKLIEKLTQNHFVFVSRINTMEPPDLVNLNNFLREYEKAGRYTLIPAHIISENKFPEPLWDYWIGKQELTVRPAWQVGKNDLDIIALREDEASIIPKPTDDSPAVSNVMEPKRKKRKRH